jgi:hypothetical protein
MNDPYLQAQLDTGCQQIRLVKLEHSNESEPIRCNLQLYAINGERPAYVALSYSWGKKERYDDIQLNGVLFPVGRSLWSFLYQMRSQRQYIVFWIDALSIDQSNVLEQNHQVQMMRQIYSSAHSVWVWLGEADEITHSNVAMHHLATREPLPRECNDFRQFWSPREARSVLELCERQYWRRIWIVQEIMLAKKATILCGDKQVNWVRLQQLVADLQTIRNRGREVHTVGVSEVLDSPATVIVKAKSQWDGTPQPLSKLLQLYRTQQSTEIRDKVYALHGLACDSHAIEVDYRIDPKDLLVELIYHICSPQASKADMKKSKKDVVFFSKMMNDVLRTFCTDEEMDFHISVARGDGVSTQKTYGVRVRGQHVVEGLNQPPQSILRPHTVVPVNQLMAEGEISRPHDPVTDEPNGREHLGDECDCIFWFLDCSFSSKSRTAWEQHCLGHFCGMEPPRSFTCHLCPGPHKLTFTSNNGWDTWTHRIKHHLKVHRFLYNGFTDPTQPDRKLFRYLREKDLVTELEFSWLNSGGCVDGTQKAFFLARAESRRNFEKTLSNELRIELWDESLTPISADSKAERMSCLNELESSEESVLARLTILKWKSRQRGVDHPLSSNEVQELKTLPNFRRDIVRKKIALLDFRPEMFDNNTE